MVGDGPVFPLLILFGLNAVDELDRTGFGILLPNIRDAFGMSNTGILSLVGLHRPRRAADADADRHRVGPWQPHGDHADGRGGVGGLLGHDRRCDRDLDAGHRPHGHRHRSGGGRPDPQRAAVGLLRGRPAPVGVLVPPRRERARATSSARCSPAVLAAAFTWRVPFFVFAVPTIVLVVLGLRIKDPVQGAQERRAAGASEEVTETEEPPPSFSEAWRLLWKIDVLRRMWYAVPFLAVAIVGFISLAGLLYEEVFDLDELQRGYLAAFVEPFQFIGLALGARLGTRLFLRGPCADLPAAARRRAHVRGPRRMLRARADPVDDGGRQHRCSPPCWRSCCPGCSPRCRWPSLPGRGRSGSRSLRGGPSPGWRCCR